MNFTFHKFHEDQPDLKWQLHFNTLWPAYRNWFLRFGEADRPTYFESVKALRKFLPGFKKIYEQMVDLAGGSDHAARFLSQYCPPPLFRGCSQAVYLEDKPVLVRSYDYSPFVFDGLLMSSKFEERNVIAMLDCMSGALDGMNDDGLVVSMSFGGREEFGTGFGISLIIRYLLEQAGNVTEASRLLKRIPINGAYNVMLLDAEQNVRTVILTPGQEPVFTDARYVTNHQPGSNWPIYEAKVYTHERKQFLKELTVTKGLGGGLFAQQFLQPPLYHQQFGKGFGTLYDAAFYPEKKACEYFWPGSSWSLGFDSFVDENHSVDFIDPNGYPSNSQRYDEVYTSKPLPILQF